MKKIKELETAKEFSNNLRRLMLNNGVSGAKMARDLQLNKASISQWMNGKNFPSPDTLKRIASYLNVSINELYGEEEVKETITYTLPNSINNVNEARSFLRTLNLNCYKETDLDSKTDKEILELAITLFTILSLFCK